MKPEVEEFQKKLPQELITLAFLSLITGVVNDWLLPSITKGMLIDGMFSKLKEMGFTEEQLETFKKVLIPILQAYTTHNDFMG